METHRSAPAGGRVIDWNNPTREDLIAAGLIVEHPDLHDMYLDNVVSPSFSQPWHQGDVGLRMDAEGKAWADQDVIQYLDDYAPQSRASARAVYRDLVPAGDRAWTPAEGEP